MRRIEEFSCTISEIEEQLEIVYDVYLSKELEQNGEITELYRLLGKLQAILFLEEIDNNYSGGN